MMKSTNEFDCPKCSGTMTTISWNAERQIIQCNSCDCVEVEKGSEHEKKELIALLIAAPSCK